MDSWMNFWCFGYVRMHRCAVITGGRMLDEWREKFVLSQQEAIEIYTEMHRHLASHGPVVRRRHGFPSLPLLAVIQWIPIFSIWCFSVFSPRSEVWSCSQERIWSSTKSNLAVPGLDTRERRVATDNYLGETQGTSAFIFQRYSRSLLGSWCFFHAFSLIAFFHSNNTPKAYGMNINFERFCNKSNTVLVMPGMVELWIKLNYIALVPEELLRLWRLTWDLLTIVLVAIDAIILPIRLAWPERFVAGSPVDELYKVRYGEKW